MSANPLLPHRLKPGDRVRFVSPASTPDRDGVQKAAKVLQNLGLKVEYGKHVFDEYGYLAGRDRDRLEDLNEALRDPTLGAIVATRGGKGAYRIANDLDFEAARRYPKLLIGFSEVTYIHLALLRHCNLAGVHGAPWNAEEFGQISADSFATCVSSTQSVVVKASKEVRTHALTTSGRVSGRLIGGNEDALATSSGWALPDLEGAIVLIEAIGLKLGHIDRQLTMLINSGALKGIKGVAVGQYVDCGSAGDTASQAEWTEVDVLRDRLRKLGVPILGGLPIGHGKKPIAVPIGTYAVLDADAGEICIDAAVR